MSKTSIAWTDTVWNPVTGCTPVSAGCANCYARSMASRFWGDREFSSVQCHENRLTDPLRWRKPRRVFVDSMGDLFHEDVPDAFIDQVFAVMALCPQHTFQVLTKRPKRMHGYLTATDVEVRVLDGARQELVQTRAGDSYPCPTDYPGWPVPNVWLGVSVENQATVDERIPPLLQTPAVLRFVSCEPLLGPINLREMAHRDDWHVDALDTPDRSRRLGWVIVGCESGPRRRKVSEDAIRSLFAQCRDAGVPCFVKQLEVNGRVSHDPAEWPEDLRVREYPS